MPARIAGRCGIAGLDTFAVDSPAILRILWNMQRP
jgi:hypothetical protein